MSSFSDLPHGLQAAGPQVLAHFHGKAGRRVGAGWRLASQTVQAHPRLQQHENLVAIISGAGQLEQQGLGEVGGGVGCVWVWWGGRAGGGELSGFAVWKRRRRPRRRPLGTPGRRPGLRSRVTPSPNTQRTQRGGTVADLRRGRAGRAGSAAPCPSLVPGGGGGGGVGGGGGGGGRASAAPCPSLVPSPAPLPNHLPPRSVVHVGAAHAQHPGPQAGRGGRDVGRREA